jgi:arginyl-tRNA--protein-N-Asp/Glu arginylyltransferase
VPLSDDLDRLDVAIRQLQVKWDLFFAGVDRKPPTDLQAHVETLVRRYANQEIRNNGERFRYQGLTARYTTFNELWQKRLRAREEGKVFGMHGLRAEQMAPPVPTRAPQASGAARAATEFRVTDAQRDTESIRALYERYVEERQRAGEAQAPGFDSFHQLIATQAERIRAEKGAQAVDFRLETRDGKVSLKARVVK